MAKAGDEAGERTPGVTDPCQWLVFDRASHFIPKQPSPPRFPNLGKFLGYFARSRSTQAEGSCRSYVQAVKDPQIRAMVFPVPNKGGSRDFEPAGHGGGGRGRDGGRGGGNRGREGDRTMSGILGAIPIRKAKAGRCRTVIDSRGPWGDLDQGRYRQHGGGNRHW